MIEARALHRLQVGPVDLTLEPGTCVSVSGRSGSGKSVLLRMIADLDPHGGDAFLDGKACSQWPVARLSTGERQRLALLRALSPKNRVLLLDDPTSGLDVASVALVEALLREQLARGTAILLVPHDPEQAARMAPRHLELRNGGIEERTP